MNAKTSENITRKKTDQKTKTTPQGNQPTAKERTLQQKLRQANKEIKTLKDQMLRTAAELDNFRKRTERDVSRIIQSANADLIKNLLPVLDNFERSLQAFPEKKKDNDYYKGISLIHKNLLTVLQNVGLEPMESVGQEFDVDRHDALLQVEKKDVKPNMVVEEHEKGYLLNGKVIRHAKVLLSK